MLFTPLLQGGVDSSSSVITVDSASNSGAGGGNTRTWTHYPSNTPSSVVLAGSNDDYSVVSASYGGVALTKVAGTGIRGVGCVFTSTSALPAGPQTVSVTFGGPSNSYLVLIAVLNSKVTNPVRRFNTRISTIPNADSISITIPAGDLGICFAGMSNLSGGGITPSDGKPTTVKLSDVTGTHALGPVSNFAWSAASAATFSMMALSIQPAVGGGDGRTLTCVNNIAKRKTQPQGMVKVDWSNPITKGLIFAYNGATNTDHVSNSVGTAKIEGISASGKAAKISTTTGQVIIPSPLPAYAGKTEVSIFSLITNTVAPNAMGTYAGLVGKWEDGPGVSRPAMGFNNGILILSSPTTDRSFGSAQTVTGRNTFCVTQNFNIASGYVNGALVGTDSPSAAYSSSNLINERWLVGGFRLDALGTEQAQGLHHLHLAWTRALTPAEVASISANPWQIFKAATKSIYVAAKSLTRRSIKLPSRKRTTQPQSIRKINWNNPLAKSICFATDYSGRDIISNTFPALVGSPVNKANLAGKSYYFGGGAANTQHLNYGNNTSTDVIFNSPGTLFFLVVPNTTTGSFAIAGKSGNDYLEGWALFQSGTGILFYDVDYNDSIINVPSGNLVAGKVNSICITYDPTVSEPKNKAYTNGVFLGGSSGWAAGGKLTDSAFPLRIGGAQFYPSGQTDYNGSVLLSVFFRRKLNLAEIASLNANPWQIFKPTNQSIYLASTPRPRSFVKVKTKPQNTQPQTTPVLRSRYAAWEWVYTPSSGTRNLGSKGIDGVFTGSAGYDGSSKAGKAYTLGSSTTSTLRLGDTTCKFTQTKPVSGLIIFRTLTTTGNEQALFIASASGAGLYVKRNGSGAIEIDCATAVLMLAGPGGEVKAGDINTVAFCIEPRVVDGGTGRVAYALNGKLVTGTWTGTPNFTSTSQFGVQVSGEAATHQQMLSCATTASISNAELVKLSKNPWSIFKGQSASLFLEQSTITAPATPSTLFAELFSGINTLYTHTVSSLYALLADLYTNSSTLYNGSVSSIRVLLASLYTNSSTLYSNTISSTRVLLVDLYNNTGELYNHSVSIFQNSVINYLGNLRTKVVTATTKAIDAISLTRTKVLAASTKALEALSATRTKLFTTGTKSVSVTSASRTKEFTPETKSKTFTTTTRG